jgi:hypothetical protein
VDVVALTTLGAVVIVLVVSALSLRAVDRIEDDFDRKLERVEDRIARLSDKISSQPAPAAQPATPPKSGPDPSRAYPIKTAGRPTKGPRSAPVTIAEFSDFQ